MAASSALTPTRGHCAGVAAADGRVKELDASGGAPFGEHDRLRGVPVPSLTTTDPRRRLASRPWVSRFIMSWSVLMHRPTTSLATGSVLIR